MCVREMCGGEMPRTRLEVEQAARGPRGAVGPGAVDDPTLDPFGPCMGPWSAVAVQKVRELRTLKLSYFNQKK